MQLHEESRYDVLCFTLFELALTTVEHTQVCTFFQLYVISRLDNSTKVQVYSASEDGRVSNWRQHCEQLAKAGSGRHGCMLPEGGDDRGHEQAN